MKRAQQLLAFEYEVGVKWNVIKEFDKDAGGRSNKIHPIWSTHTWGLGKVVFGVPVAKTKEEL